MKTEQETETNTPPPTNGETAAVEESRRVRPKWLVPLVAGLFLCVGLVLVFNVTDYMLLSYMPSYLTSELGYDAAHGLAVVLGVMVLMMVVQPFAGALTDRVGRRLPR